ncbi:unnamed protein product [Peronospora belbahrii]|uniref:LysM domain-containing protein n=1 Tax=Peronospora belbahrii TaxID=622444 RepID=A0ABN8D517_9STRA|nr:unnamed protein product [Peronospora belbahrii]
MSHSSYSIARRWRCNSALSVASCLKLHVVSASDIIDDIDAKHVAFSQENSQTNNYINVYVELNHSTLRCRVQAGDSIPKLEGVCA